MIDDRFAALIGRVMRMKSISYSGTKSCLMYIAQPLTAFKKG